MTTQTITLFGKKADFFLNGKVRIFKITKLDRERSAVDVTFLSDEE